MLHYNKCNCIGLYYVFPCINGLIILYILSQYLYFLNIFYYKILPCTVLSVSTQPFINGISLGLAVETFKNKFPLI